MTPSFRSILMAVDFGPESKSALRLCASLGRQLGASIHLLHVARDPMHGVSGPELSGIDWQRLRNEVVRQASRSLAELAAGHPDAHIVTEVAVGSPVETIVQAARDVSAGLIVMGAHGRCGFGRLIIGSVAERVIRLSACPVMTVRATGATHVRHGGADVDRQERVVA